MYFEYSTLVEHRNDMVELRIYIYKVTVLISMATTASLSTVMHYIKMRRTQYRRADSTISEGKQDRESHRKPVHIVCFKV
jgi:hypothetical protein